MTTEHTTSDSAGAANQPHGATNTGTGADRRAEPGLPAPGTNQGKAEPMPPTGDRVAPHPAAREEATAEADAVGTDDPHAGHAPSGPNVSVPARRPGQVGRSPMESRPRLGVPGGAGHAYRTPGHQGESPSPIETDVVTSAARTAAAVVNPSVASPGNIDGVFASAVEPLEGSSGESGVAEGARTPLSPTTRAAGTPGKPAIAPRPSAPDGEVGPR